jgi:(2Fe-2S) ferredoxin
MTLDEKLFEACDKLKIGSKGKHIFLCADVGKCCAKENGLASWEHLKKRTEELNLTKQVHVWRTKSGCLRVCTKGPICVIYPDGVWYHSCTEDVIDRILKEHILEGTIVKEYQIVPR